MIPGLEKPITIGTWSGLTTGLFQSCGVIHEKAQKFLDELPRHPNSWEEEGVLKSLLELGLAERRGFLWWKTYHRVEAQR